MLDWVRLLTVFCWLVILQRHTGLRCSRQEGRRRPRQLRSQEKAIFLLPFHPLHPSLALVVMDTIGAPQHALFEDLLLVTSTNHALS